MLQDRKRLLISKEYARSKYKESNSLSNKNRAKKLNLIDTGGAEEVAIVLGLSQDDAREWEIDKLHKQLVDLDKSISSIEYFILADDFKGVLKNIENKEQYSVNSPEGDRILRTLGKIGLAYKHSDTITVLNKSLNDTRNVYKKLEELYDAYIKEFNNPRVDLERATWVGVAEAVNNKCISIYLRGGNVVKLEANGREEDIANDIMKKENSHSGVYKSDAGGKVWLRYSDVSSIVVE